MLDRKIGGRRHARKMGIGFVDQHHRTLGLVGDQPFDIGQRRDRAGRVVRRADVIQPGIGVGGEHRLYVVRIIGGQRHGLDRRAEPGGGAPGEFEGGVGGHQSLGRRTESDDAAAQGVARSRPRGDVIVRHLLDRHNGLDEIAALILRRIAIALRDHLRRRQRAGSEWAGPAFVRADAHLGVGRGIGHATRCPGRPPNAGGNCARAEHGGNPREIAARETASQQIVLRFIRKCCCGQVCGHRSVPCFKRVAIHPAWTHAVLGGECFPVSGKKLLSFWRSAKGTARHPRLTSAPHPLRARTLPAGFGPAGPSETVGDRVCRS